MHHFEDKFAAFGRRIDGVVERLRHRSPRRYRSPSVGPTLRERWRERRARWRDGLYATRWTRWRDWDREERSRVVRGGMVIAVFAGIGVGWWLVRTSGQSPTLDELMTQAKIQARLEVADEAVRPGPFMGWGKKK